MGSDTNSTDITLSGHPLLDLPTARRLFTAVGIRDDVQALHHIQNTNDVFRAVTAGGRRYYLKFHTAGWYKEAEDTAAVVHRESMVARLLRDRGIPLAYNTWVDDSRSIVARSVLITEELPGTPVPAALASSPADQEAILGALARYLGRLHALRFPVAGYFEYCGDPDVHPLPGTDPGTWWDSHPCQKAANLQPLALRVVEAKRDLLPSPLADEIQTVWHGIAERLAADYERPTLVVNNFHPFHFHVTQERGVWDVTGFYDFEAAASGNPAFDLALNDLQITPLVGGTGWRRAFLQHYGLPPRFESYKTVLLIYVLMALQAEPTSTAPEPAWLIDRFPALLKAKTVDDLTWFPQTDAGSHNLRDKGTETRS